MGDWVQCTVCCRQPSKNAKFFLGTCGHIFCESCARREAQLHCPVCQSICQVKELNDKLDQNLKAFFMVPETQIKKQLEVIKYQSTQKSLYMKQMRKKIDSQNKMIANAEEQFAKMNKKIESLQANLEKSDKLVMQLQYDKTILKTYIRRLKDHESGQMTRPTTPRHLLTSPNVPSPYAQTFSHRISPHQSPMNISTSAQRGRGTLMSPANPIAPLPQRRYGTPSLFLERQNTPYMGRMSVRQPPSKGRFGTPTQQTIESGYRGLIASPVVEVVRSPAYVTASQPSSVMRTFDSMDPKFPNSVRVSDSAESFRYQPRRSSHQNIENLKPSPKADPRSLSSKYFVRVDKPNEPCTTTPNSRHYTPR